MTKDVSAFETTEIVVDPAAEKGMIDIQDVFFEYANGPEEITRVLNGVTFQVHTGEFVALMGANGSGKTTLARCLNGLAIPSKGTILIDGMDTRDESRLLEIRRRVGMVFQNPDNQIVSATVEREIAFGLENLGVPFEEMHRRVNAMMQQFNLTHYRQKSPHYLSGGEKQRLALAAVMAMNPRYLVLDEPTSLLDPRSRSEILETLRIMHTSRSPLSQKMTFLLITQFSDEALLADRLIVLHNGSVIMDGPPAKLFDHIEEFFKLGLEPPIQFVIKKMFRTGRLKKKS